MTQDEAKQILERTLAFVAADEAEVSLFAGSTGNLRFACNVPTTTGHSNEFEIRIKCAFGKREGSFSTTVIDDTMLRCASERAQRLARLSPENLEHMPLLGPQEYRESSEHEEKTAHSSPTQRAEMASLAIQVAQGKGLIASGYCETSEQFLASFNSKGQYYYHPLTKAYFALTIRTSDGKGSGWAGGESFRISSVGEKHCIDRAIKKALSSHQPQPLEPGIYSVILEPSATGSLLDIFYSHLNRRRADEGRSYFSDSKNGTKIGQKLFGENITIYSDHTDPVLPSVPWGEAGLALDKTIWVENGAITRLPCERYWAQQKKISPQPRGSNIIMAGGNHTIGDLIASTERGLLITSFWYIRSVDPQTLLHTGLTRDGVFLIEKGKIAGPVNNFRWNESPAAVFQCVDMMSPTERVVIRDENALPIMAPAIKVKEFHFTSVSEAL